MSSRTEALSDCRRLLRTFAAAPDPRRQAQAVAAVLVAVEDWDAEAQAELAAFKAWLAEGPSPAVLKSRCEAVVCQLLDWATPSRRAAR